MLEVEVKYRCSNWDAIQHRLAALGATVGETRIEVDRYFAPPDRDFAQTDEAVRIRSIAARNRFTYKGPKLDAATKTRREIEVPIADGPEAAALAEQFLLALRYRIVAQIAKTRSLYALTRDGFPVEICFDDAGEIGRFIEVEIQATPEQFPAARAALLALAAELGLTEVEPKSYLRLHLERAAGS